MARKFRKTIRFSEREMRELKNKADTAGRDISAYIRSAVFQYDVAIIPGLPELNHQIAKIGNNLNQLTMLSHQGSIKSPNLEETREMLDRVYEKLFEISEAINNGSTSMGDG
ncbi:MAG: MobC family plasmid mobilization relaxosome protein [Eubacterium sp.]|jgi:hypothetical protein|nr:MobC family plasmid mobilization relaxosome protein [Eubacterium sp.]